MKISSNLIADHIKRKGILRTIELRRKDDGEVLRVSLDIGLNDLPWVPEGEEKAVEIKLREVNFLDHENSPKSMLIVASEPYDPRPVVEATVYWNTEQRVSCDAGYDGEPIVIPAGLYSSTVNQVAADAIAHDIGMARLVCVPVPTWELEWQVYTVSGEETIGITGWELEEEVVP